MHALKTSNLSKTYPNGVQAANHISLNVNPGDFFALLGPNGAGKSTFIGIITGLVNKSAGQVVIFGHDFDHDKQAAKRAVGLVPQEFNFNVFEPIEQILMNQAGYYGIPRKQAKQRAETYLKKLELWDKRNTPARELSGGMKRRLMIARALIHEPKLLILDEPTAGVDIEVRRSMWTFLKQLNAQGTTIILTTHYLEEAESLCRHIAIIDKGEVIENTTMRELLKQLHSETLILYSKEPLTAAPKIPNFTLRLIDPNTIEVDISEGQTINNLITQLSNQMIHVTGMKNKATRLETLFLQLVGKESA